MLASGAEALASSPAPLATAVEAGRLSALAPAVRIGATVASLGVLLSLIVGVSRTTFAMAANRDLPHWLAAVHPRYMVPHRAEIVVGLVVAAVAATADVRSAIGFSSFAVLTSYGVANAAALTLAPGERRWPSWVAACGLLGCRVLAFTLPIASVVSGTLVLGLGALVFGVRRTFDPAR